MKHYPVFLVGLSTAFSTLALAGGAAQQKVPTPPPDSHASIFASPVFWAAAVAAVFGLINVLVTTTTTSQTNRRTTELTTRTQVKNAELAAQTQRDLAQVSSRTQEQISSSNSERNIKLEEIKAQLQAQRDENLEWREHKKTIAKYKDPLMHAVYDLQSRLFNIIDIDKVFLSAYYVRGTESQRAYAVENTVFLFCQFLAWNEIIRRQIQFLNLGADSGTKDLREIQDNIYTTLQTDRFGPGFRIFAGDQRAIGEMMIETREGELQCIGFATYMRLLCWLEIPEDWRVSANYWLKPLRDDVIAMASIISPFRGRVIALQHSMIDMLDALDPHYVYFPKTKRTKLAT
jgi:hypothetical protein